MLSQRRARRQTGEEASVHQSREWQAEEGGTAGAVSGENTQVASVAGLCVGLPWVLN